MCLEENKALTLWKRWFEWSGMPWESSDWSEFGWYCFFCGEEEPNHKQDCVYVAAKRLVEYETGSGLIQEVG